MKLSTYRAPNSSDFPEMPKGVEEPLKVTSKQVTDITTALQGKLTVQDNFDAELVEVPAKHNDPFVVTLQKAGSRPIGATLIYISGGQTGYVAVENLSEKKVRLRLWLHSESLDTFTVRIIIWCGGT